MRWGSGLKGWGNRESAEADLGQDALAGEQFGAEADDETEHGETAVPGFSEVDETEASLSVVGHGLENRLDGPNVTKVGDLLPVIADTRTCDH